VLRESHDTKEGGLHRKASLETRKMRVSCLMELCSPLYALERCYYTQIRDIWAAPEGQPHI